MVRVITFFALIGMFFTGVNASEVVKIQSQQIQHWNHPATSPEQFKGLKSQATAYAPFIENTATTEKIHITLIKKLANWHQQHSNGLKIVFSQPELTFGQIKAFSFRLSLDKQASFIPSLAQVKKGYSKYIDAGLIDEQWLKALLSEHGVINIKFFGAHHEDQNIATVLANYQLVIKSSMVSSAKLKQEKTIDILLSDFDFYRQKNWQEQPISRDEIKSVKVMGLLITAETSNEKTLRSYLLDNYIEELPEYYTELAISFADVTLELAD
ncbi:hypothetical protein [Thalassotalea castellviae]|uniref:Uncharacterized protein n=1 Tax=Thalassotalea castellviae TaxID=3075612 RepID=A0ABU3A4B7_9GAMM|nr:hypothetical protein [Thalassotalea sp. W431]MDT0604382.1 hypothetical protein [Thalassotalea sp. W431]